MTGTMIVWCILMDIFPCVKMLNLYLTATHVLCQTVVQKCICMVIKVKGDYFPRLCILNCKHCRWYYACDCGIFSLVFHMLQHY